MFEAGGIQRSEECGSDIDRGEMAGKGEKGLKKKKRKKKEKKDEKKKKKEKEEGRRETKRR